MGELEFRKFLTTYGISYEEYKAMSGPEQQELEERFTSESKTKNLENIGKGCQGLGCLIILIPVLVVLLYFIFSIAFSSL